jgi:hypothetical protein
LTFLGIEASTTLISSLINLEKIAIMFWLSFDKVELTLAIKIFGFLVEFFWIENAKSRNG